MIPSNTNTLNVTVLDSITRSPIQGVAVTRNGATICNNVQDNLTNALGVCTGTNQNAGSVTLSALKDGYEPTTATASIVSRDSDVIILMRPNFFMVNITDGSGNALSGATINYGANWINSCNENPIGTFKCAALTTSASPLKISKGNLVEYISAYTGTGPLSVVLNQADTVLGAPGQLTVNVVDQNNVAVTDATININNDVACILDSGVCKKSELTVGQYLIQASKGGETGFMTVSMTAETQTKATIVVRTIASAANFTISVFDSSGTNGISGASVTTANGACTSPSSNHIFTCSGMSLIPTSFLIHKDGFSDAYVNGTPTTSLNGSVNVILNKNKNGLTVKVVDATSTSTPLQNAVVSGCISDVNTEGKTDLDGNCTKSGVAIGTLPIQISLTNYETAFASVTISSTGDTSLTVALRPKNPKIYFNIFDSRTGKPIEATVTGVATDPYTCALGGCSVLPSAKGVLTFSVANVTSGYLSATATVAYIGYPVALNFYLTQVSTLTVNFTQTKTPPDALTVSISGFSGAPFSCTATSTCSISNLPFGYYNVTATNADRTTTLTGSISVNAVSTSVTLQ
jgi:hypothetical protein